MYSYFTIYTFYLFSVENSPRPKKKSEIRSLLDATTTVADNNKPQWMSFHSHNHASSQQAAGAGVDNPAFEDEAGNGKTGEVGANSVLPWKREDHEVQVHVMTDQHQQSPGYIRNKEFVSYSSPNNSLHVNGDKKRHAIIGYFQKRDSLTFLGDLDNLDSKASSRRNSKEGTDLLSVLANPVNIRKHSAPPLNRQKSLSSMKVFKIHINQSQARLVMYSYTMTYSPFQPFEDDERNGPQSPTHLTPIIERKNKDTVLSFEDELFKRK